VLSLAVAALVAAWLPFSAFVVDAVNRPSLAAGQIAGTASGSVPGPVLRTATSGATSRPATASAPGIVAAGRPATAAAPAATPSPVTTRAS
jgi:type IV secretory pathway VirB6-like protein